jgi:hypothetical protein
VELKRTDVAWTPASDSVARSAHAVIASSAGQGDLSGAQVDWLKLVPRGLLSGLN